MNETMQLKRAWIGGYNRQDVQEYIDDLYIDMEKKHREIAERAESVSQENQLLLQYINESEAMSDVVEELNLTTDITDDKSLFNLPEGVYQVEDQQKIVQLATPHADVKAHYHSDVINLSDIKQKTETANKASQSIYQKTQPVVEEKASLRPEPQVSREPIEQSYVEEPPRQEPVVERVKLPRTVEEQRNVTTNTRKQTDSELEHRLVALEEENMQLKAKLAFANELLKDLYKQ
ncbi:hypothetical protein HYQ40_07015 [Aerococcaceae bacterium DSM 111021]|nr:hypothetical protein [Aerococcaceae bacterium DSM 111021]